MTQFSQEAAARYGVQDYGPKPTIEGLEIIQLRRFNDDGGAMTELGRLDSGKLQGVDGFEVRQINYSVMEPLAIKAFHLHKLTCARARRPKAWCSVWCWATPARCWCAFPRAWPMASRT